MGSGAVSAVAGFVSRTAGFSVRFEEVMRNMYYIDSGKEYVHSG